MIGAAEGCDKVATFDPSTGTTRAATYVVVESSARVSTVVNYCEPKRLIICRVFDGKVATSWDNRSSGLDSRAEAPF